MSVVRFMDPLPDECEYQGCASSPEVSIADPLAEFPIETIEFYCGQHGDVVMAHSKPIASAYPNKEAS